MKEYPKRRQGNDNRGNKFQSSSIAPPRKTARGATSGYDRGAIRIYFITSRHEKEDSPDVVTGMIKVFNLNVYICFTISKSGSIDFDSPHCDEF